MEIPVRVFLHEYSARGGERGIGHDEKGFVVVGEGENWLLKEHVLYFIECEFVVDRPLPLGVLVGE